MNTTIKAASKQRLEHGRRRFKRTWSVTIVLHLAACGIATARAAIIPHNLSANSPNFQLHDFCVGPTPGGTTLANNGQVAELPSNTLPGVLGALNSQFSTWNFTLGDDLNGNFFVDRYQAYDLEGTYPTSNATSTDFVFEGGNPSICYHSAIFKGHYNPSSSDDYDNYGFIQLIGTNQPAPGAPSDTLYVDPFTGNADDIADNAPFYWNGVDHPHNYLTLLDASVRSHFDVDLYSAKWRTVLFVATWKTSSPNNITIHDSVVWGFDAVCVPEPSSLVMILSAGFVGVFFGWRNKKVSGTKAADVVPGTFSALASASLDRFQARCIWRMSGQRKRSCS